MSEEDSLAEDDEEAQTLYGTRLSIALEVYKGLLAYYGSVNAGIVARGGTCSDLKFLPALAVEHADRLLKELDGEA